MAPEVDKHSSGLAVSVVTTVKDGIQHLPGFFARLRATTGDIREIIFVDDGSTDGSYEAALLATSEDSRLLVIRNDGLPGVAGARTAGLARTRGDFLWFVDCDDDWDFSIVTRLAAEATRTGADVVVSRLLTVDEEGAPLRFVDGMDESRVLDSSAAVAAVLAGRLRGFLPNKLIRRDVLGQAPFPPVRWEDFAATIRAVERSGKVAVIPDVLYRYVQRPGSVTRASSVPPGEALACARIAEEVWQARADAVPRSLYEYFLAWAVVVELVHAPLRLREPDARRRPALATALQVAQEIRLSSVARWDLRTALTLAAIRVMRGRYRHLYRTGRVLASVRRPLRRRLATNA